MTYTDTDLKELSRFIAAVQNTEPLDVASPEDEKRYVTKLQGKRDALSRLQSEIRHREGDGVYLFTGQVGSGKSTELLRLKAQLQGPKCKVFYCDLEDWLNLNTPMDLSSFLLALVAAWVDAVGTLHGKRSPVERLRDFFTRTELTLGSLTLGVDMAGAKAQIQMALKTDESFRSQLEHSIQNKVGSFVRQAHGFIAELVADVCAQNEKCVLIADSLEKIRGYDDQTNAVYASVQRLFLSEGNALRLPGVHVVYSVSPFLLANNPQLPSILGQGVVVNMPSVHVFENRSNQLDRHGVAQMTEMLKLRYADWEKWISPDLLEHLVRDCGGDLRDFLRAVKVVLLEREAEPESSPDDLLNVVRSQISPSKLVPTEHLAWMARLERSHEAEICAQVDNIQFQRYLATKHILAYLNGDTWYAIHPLLRDWVLGRPEAQLPSPVLAATAAA
jgi:hypothetical protein